VSDGLQQLHVLFPFLAVHAITWLPCTGNQATDCQVTLLGAAFAQTETCLHVKPSHQYKQI